MQYVFKTVKHSVLSDILTVMYDFIWLIFGQRNAVKEKEMLLQWSAFATSYGTANTQKYTTYFALYNV